MSRRHYPTIQKTDIVPVSENISVSTITGNVYQIDTGEKTTTKPSTIMAGGYEVIRWGRNNLLPNQYRQILLDNDIKQSIIETAVDLAAGQGFFLYREQINGNKLDKIPVKDAQLEDWIESWSLHDFFVETIQDVKEVANSFAEFVMTRDRTQVASVMSIDALDCRLEKGLKNVLIADWKEQRKQSSVPVEAVPRIDNKNPNLLAHKKGILHIQKYVSGMPFYSYPEWHGTVEWTEIANIIPKFHKQGLKNGYMLRYHVKIPLSYFKGKTDKEIEVMKKEVTTRLDQVLSGAENAHKAFISFVQDNLGASNVSEWKIEKIETDLKDSSYLDLHRRASEVHSQGHGLDPALSGIHTAGRLSSGSEIRNLLNYHIAYKTPRVRRMAMQPINLIKAINFPGKRDIKIGVIDTEFTTTDSQPSGTQQILQNG
jgi:hypothetical protein